jgi:hypothetical protein
MLKALNGGAEEFPGARNGALSAAEIGDLDLRLFNAGDAAAIRGLGGVADPEGPYRQNGQRKREYDSPALGYSALRDSRAYGRSDQLPFALS